MERSFGAALLRIDKPMEKLSALIEEALHVSEDVEHLFIVYTELWLMNIREDKYNDYMSFIKNLHNDLKNLTARMIDEGKKLGLWDKDTDSDALAAYLVASFDGVIVHYMMDKGNFDIRRVTKEFIRFVLRQGKP
jgi:hypothetical protein